MKIQTYSSVTHARPVNAALRPRRRFKYYIWQTWLDPPDRGKCSYLARRTRDDGFTAARSMKEYISACPVTSAGDSPIKDVDAFFFSAELADKDSHVCKEEG